MQACWLWVMSFWWADKIQYIFNRDAEVTHITLLREVVYSNGCLSHVHLKQPGRKKLNVFHAGSLFHPRQMKSFLYSCEEESLASGFGHGRHGGSVYGSYIMRMWPFSSALFSLFSPSTQTVLCLFPQRLVDSDSLEMWFIYRLVLHILSGLLRLPHWDHHR